MAAVDTTYDLVRGIATQVTGEVVAGFVMIQNVSKFPIAVWFQDTAPVLGTDRPDLIWAAGAYEGSFPNPAGATQAWMSPAGNAPFASVRIVHAAV